MSDLNTVKQQAEELHYKLFHTYGEDYPDSIKPLRDEEIHLIVAALAAAEQRGSGLLEQHHTYLQAAAKKKNLTEGQVLRLAVAALQLLDEGDLIRKPRGTI